MFRYFPTNYVWNLSVDLAIEMGARIGEIEAMCAPLQEAARAPDAAGTRAFRESWVHMANRLCELAGEDEARGRLLSAGEKLRRASGYLITAERLQAHDAPGRLGLYQRALALFLTGSRMLGDRVQRVEHARRGQLQVAR
ncbi:MAG TPA: alpha/beta hydrolase, partial [Rubrivivax sp.]|nr:alpha/beta hydrolase [Rubrivivax sp.]